MRRPLGEWTTIESHRASERKLSRLLNGLLKISLEAPRLKAVIQARNSLVHAGRFTSGVSEQFVIEYRNLLLLGRSILRLVGVRSMLHDAIQE